MNAQRKIVQASDLHFEQKNWTNELKFWKDELLTFQHRLEEVASSWTNPKIKGKVEHFQNQFIIHHEIISKLLESIAEHEYRLAYIAKKENNSVDEWRIAEHPRHRMELDTERVIFHELKKDFFLFLTKTM